MASVMAECFCSHAFDACLTSFEWKMHSIKYFNFVTVEKIFSRKYLSEIPFSQDNRWDNREAERSIKFHSISFESSYRLHRFEFYSRSAEACSSH